MTEPENPTGPLPERLITPNQLVAYNVAFFRKAAGMTQEELAGRLITYTHESWSKATVSAAERSFDEGGRIREFDANDLLAFSMALGVPVLGFFLPPVEDGTDASYKIAGSPSTPGGITTARLMEILFRNPTQEARRNVDEYHARVRAAHAQYFPGPSGAALPDYLVRQELEESLIKIDEALHEAGLGVGRVRHWIEEGQAQPGDVS